MNTEENPSVLSETNTNLPGFLHALLLIAIAGVISIIIGPLIQLGGKFSPLLNDWSLFIGYTLSFWIVLIIAQKWWQVPHFDTKRALPSIESMIVESQF